MKEFGFDNAIFKLKKIENNAKGTKNEIKKGAEKIKDEARKIAMSKGLKVTGRGIDGIISKHSDYESIVGWGSRPNLHLYFHEIGFHAGFSKATRASKGKRKRFYKKGTRKYIAPKPHIRPAVTKKKDEIIKDIKENLFK